jgi:hypothetical protein
MPHKWPYRRKRRDFADTPTPEDKSEGVGKSRIRHPNAGLPRSCMGPGICAFRLRTPVCVRRLLSAPLACGR